MKLLRFVVPAVQALLLVFAGFWHLILDKHYANHPEAILGYASAPIYVLLKVNFPLAILWFPVFSALAWASSNSYLTLGGGGATDVIVLAVLDVAILSSVALFWYFVVVEIEMRKREASCLRFSRQWMETLKAIVVIFAGVGAALFALWDGHRLMALDRVNRHHFFWATVVGDALIGGLFLFGWAAALIVIGAQDIGGRPILSRFLRKGGDSRN